MHWSHCSLALNHWYEVGELPCKLWSPRRVHVWYANSIIRSMQAIKELRYLVWGGIRTDIYSGQQPRFLAVVIGTTQYQHCQNDMYNEMMLHDKNITRTWKQFAHYWPFVMGSHQSPVDSSPHRVYWHICVITQPWWVSWFCIIGHCGVSLQFGKFDWMACPQSWYRVHRACMMLQEFKTHPCSTFIITELHAVSLAIGPCPDATQLYVTKTCDSGMTQCNHWL